MSEMEGEGTRCLLVHNQEDRMIESSFPTEEGECGIADMGIE
jgi:hypothetical protein